MNRRRFLQTTGTALAIGAIAQPLLRSQATPPKKRNIRKAIMYGTIGLKGSIAEKLRAVKAAGFEGVEPMSHLPQEEMVQALKETGLEAPSVCCATHWNDTLSHPDAAVRAKGLEGLKQALRDAHRYGSKSVLLVPAVVNKQVSYADAYTRSQEQIHLALPLASELKVKIAIENVWNQFLLSPLEAARYVDEFKSPWVAWHFDIGNILNFGFPEQWIRILGPRIAQLHIKEYSRKRRDKEGPGAGFGVDFLEGDNDWPTVMKALDGIGYQGWGIAEQGGGGTPEGLAKLASGMDRIFAS